MYEERWSEMSTHNTSYHERDLKDEYQRKLNELELEKEELEYYKKKYKRKAEKLNQEKRKYHNRISEIISKSTPLHTEESQSENLPESDLSAINGLHLHKTLYLTDNLAHNGIGNNLTQPIENPRRQTHSITMPQKPMLHPHPKESTRSLELSKGLRAFTQDFHLKESDLLELRLSSDSHPTSFNIN